MKLDITVLVGIVFGVAALVLGFMFGGGSLGALMEGTSAIIVFGGTIGATIVSFSLRDIRRLPYFFSLAFQGDSQDPMDLIDQLCGFVDQLRKTHSVLILEELAGSVKDNWFLSKGLALIADRSSDAETLGQRFESEMLAEHEADERGVELFETAGGYAPTMGIAGTVMGLIHVLGSLNGGATVLAAGIAMAFTATLYGVGSANLFWLPLSANLKTKSKHRLLMREITVDGLIWLAKQPNVESSSLLRAKLLGYVQASLGTSPHPSGSE